MPATSSPSFVVEEQSRVGVKVCDRVEFGEEKKEKEFLDDGFHIASF